MTGVDRGHRNTPEQPAIEQPSGRPAGRAVVDAMRGEQVGSGPPNQVPVPARPESQTLTPSGVLRLQREVGNAALTPVLRSAGLQRDTDPTGDRQSPPNPTSLRMRDPLDELQVSLEQSGRGPLWGIIAGLPQPKSSPAPLARLLPSLQPTGDAPQRTQMVFGPLSTDEALRALTQAPQKPDWVDRMLRTETLEEQAASESDVDLYVVYSNDGTGNVANQGSGADQGDTAGVKGYATFNKHGTGLSRIGLTLIGMTTPRGTLPEGASFGPESTYQTPKGPYSGALTVDVGVTVSRSGGSVIDFIASAGVDSREWGELIQDAVHEVSKSPKFPWPSGTKPLLEGGVTWNHTIDDLTNENFAGLSYTGRLELDASAITGTRRTEGTVGARFVIRTAKVRTGAGDISVEFSPVGVLARGFVRYNDGREQALPGVEAGVNSSVMLNIGRVGLGLRGEAIASTDPAFQTGTEAGSHPTALKASPFVGEGHGMPAGHHGTGQLIFKVSF